MLISLRADKTRRICFDALLTATAMLLSYLETVIPLQMLIPLPGVRLGLANFAVVTVFALVSPWDAALVSAVRILATGLLFGSVTSLYFSALGGLCSFLMLLLFHQHACISQVGIDDGGSLRCLFVVHGLLVVSGGLLIIAQFVQ